MDMDITELNFTAEITINRETRPVEFSFYDYSDRDSVWARGGRGAHRIGNGAKLHGNSLELIGFKDAAVARRKGWREPVAEAHGRVWFHKTDGICIRNRHARLVAWADTYTETKVATAQKYYGSL